MAILWLIGLKIGIALQTMSPWLSTPLIYMSAAGIFINCVLMVLNLLPLPPLDGGRVVTGLLPGPLSWKFSRLEPYGLIIVLVLFMTNILGKILSPVLAVVLSLLLAMGHISPGLLQSMP
jgi:Zn-dependent protease